VYVTPLFRRKLGGALTSTTSVAAVIGIAACGAAMTERVQSHGSFAHPGYVTIADGTWASAAAVRVQPNGYIITAGEARIGRTTRILVSRYTPSGGVDSAFGKGGTATISIGGVAGVDSGAALALQPDGKIVVAGSGRLAGGLAFAAVRLTPRGTLDKTFGHGGIVTIPIGQSAIANAVVFEPSGRILLGGVATVDGVDHFAVVRLLPDGSLDSRFGAGGVSLVTSPNAGAWGMVLEPDGRPVLAGWGTVNGRIVYMVASMTPSGAPDPSFGNQGVLMVPFGADARADAIALEPDGQLVVSGDATLKGIRTVVTMRLRADSSIDRSFGSRGVVMFAKGWGVNGIAGDTSGHILLAGGGPSLVVLNPDGSFDNEFGSGGVFRHRIGRIASANDVAISRAGHFILAGAAEVDGKVKEFVMRVKG
jgi:uncharacterized delta-60 repeat protein